MFCGALAGLFAVSSNGIEAAFRRDFGEQQLRFELSAKEVSHDT
jgi:hypothetical protein